MKRNFLPTPIVAVLLLIFCVSLNSCEKNEAYNPERKIKKIYTGTADGPKYLEQKWTWDENKLLRIDYYYDDGDIAYIAYTEHYTYEENKLVMVENRYGYFQIFYSGFRYNKIEYYSNAENLLIGTWEFLYKNNKISKTIFTFDEPDIWIDKITQNGFISFLIPKEFIPTIESSAKRGAARFITTYKYNGNNIKEQKLGLDGSEYSAILIYKSYDKMLNPFYKHADWNNFEVFTSKNNPLEVEITSPAGHFSRVIDKLSYKYDKNFPIEMVRTRVFDNDSGFGNKTYYEYE